MLSLALFDKIVSQLDKNKLMLWFKLQQVISIINANK